MIKYNDITLKEVFDLSHYINNISIINKRNLQIRDNAYTIDHNTWINLFMESRQKRRI